MSNEIELNHPILSTTTWPEQCKPEITTNPIPDVAQMLMGFTQSIKDTAYTTLQCLTPSRSFSDYLAVCKRSLFLFTRSNKGYTPLHVATILKQPEEIKKLLDLGADPNTVDIDGELPLHYAIISKNTDIVDMLARHGSQINTKDNGGYTPLHFAIALKQPEMVNKLLDLGADPNIVDINNELPLHHAARSNDLDIVEMLAQHGSQINTQDAKGYTPLHFAIILQQPQMVKKLLELGADPNIMDIEGELPLHHAVRSKNIEIVDMLKQHGAQINTKNAKGYSPLHIAIALKQPEMVKKLLDLGADPNATTDSEGFTPLHLAAIYQNVQIAESLLLHGGTYNPALTSPDDIALIKLITILSETKCEAARKLTAIVTANPLLTQSELIKKVKGVLDRHGRYIAGTVTSLVGLGLMAERIIASDHTLSYAGMILASVGLIISTTEPSTLREAISKCDLEKIKNLIKSNTDINARDLNGHTPLFLAVMLDKFDLVEELITLGADVDLPCTDYGITPLYTMLVRYANTKTLEMAIQASNGTSQERIDRSLLANRFALDGVSELSTNLYGLGGSKTELALPAVKKATSSFYSPIIEDLQKGDDKAWNNILKKLSPKNRQRIDSLSKSKVIEILKNALEAVTNSVPESVDIALERHAKGLPVAIATSWTEEIEQSSHQVSLVLYGNKIARCNKGGGSADTPGALISTIGKPEALRQAVESCHSETTKVYFTQEIVTELELSPHKHFVQNTQKGPNCTLASTNSMGPIALYMQLAPLVGDEAAEEFTKVFKSLNLIDTRLNSVQHYLNKHEQPQPFGIDIGLIGQIYSKKTGKPEVDQQIRDMIEKWAAKRNINLNAATILGTVQAVLGHTLDADGSLPDLSLISRAYEIKTGSDDIDRQLRSMIDLWAKKRNLEWQEMRLTGGEEKER